MTMTVREMFEIAEKLAEDLYFDFECIGIRFENKEREIGEVCEHSKHNPDREDERDFPDYDSPEYAELPELDGTSAYKINALKSFTPSCAMDRPAAEYFWNTKHCYLIASNEGHSGDDEGEIVIDDAKIIHKFF